MAYVRISIMRPDPENRQQVEAILDDVLRYDMTLTGFLSGQRLTPLDDTGEIWRITYWESEDAANHAAQQQHVLSRRAELLRILPDDGHEERSLQTV